MKNKILIAIIAGLLLGFTGCGTSSEKDGKVVENKTEAIQTENAVNLDDVSEENGNITEDQQVRYANPGANL